MIGLVCKEVGKLKVVDSNLRIKVIMSGSSVQLTGRHR